MRPPRFWDNPPERPGWQAHALAPLSLLYARATAQRLSRPGYRARIPVICIGNIAAGGTGKTPTVIALAERLRGAGVEAQVVSRGHGGQIAGPVRVDERRHSADDVGDEPLLLAAFAPVWVSKDRAAGVWAAEAAGAQAVLLDDGFQNPSVEQDLRIVVVDAARGFGNGRVLPAGPLREPVAVGLARADLVVAIGNEPAQQAFQARWGLEISVPVVPAALMPLATGMDWQDLAALAFAGIGHPEKFFATLRGLGADVRRAEALDDHQPLTEALMARLSREAKALAAQLVTTEKDAVRLPASYRAQVLTLPVRLRVEDWRVLDEAFAGLGLACG